MTDKGYSLQDLIRTRQSGAFVGRTEPLRRFEESLSLPVSDPRRRFLFSVHGDAGIGKTSLVRQWEQTARTRAFLTGYVDEGAFDVPSALEIIAADFRGQGTDCTEFTEKLAAYRKRRHEVVADPGTPAGISSLLTRSAVRIGLRAAEGVPVLGPFAGEINKDEAAQQADRARVFLAKRFSRPQDVELLLSPVEVLTSAFLTDLRSAGGKHAVALFFDTFERTGEFLNHWLLDVLAGRYGALPANTILVVSGQRPLESNLWGSYLAIRADIRLEVFSEEEAHQLLQARGVTDERAIELILNLSGRLPVLLATLAESPDAVADDREDPSDTAVDRFLKWESDPDRRAAALSGSLPRRLDHDVMEVVADAPVDFDWLRRLPFVVSHTDGYRYHSVVRTPMLRSIRRNSPRGWTEKHSALAEHYRSRAEALELPRPKRWDDVRWRDLAIEECYHELCAKGSAALPLALNRLLRGYGRTPDAEVRWAQMITEAGTDSDDQPVRERGRQLSTWLAGGDDGELALLTSLAGDPLLDDAHRGIALAERSDVHERVQRYAEALDDLERADALRPDTYWILAWRGALHTRMDNFSAALADLDRAIALNPDYGWALRARADLHRARQDYARALPDLNRAIELIPDDASLMDDRGLVHYRLGHSADAVSDYTRSLQLYPDDAWTVGSRAMARQDLGEFPEALADYDHAIRLRPDSDWMLFSRGELLLTMGRVAEALEDLTRAIELDPEYDHAHGLRGSALRRLGRLTEAVASLDRALEIDPEYGWALRERGWAHHQLRRYAAALSDLNEAVEINSGNVVALILRGMALGELGRPDEAHADFRRALDLEPGSPFALTARALLHRQTGNLTEALADLDQVLADDPSDTDTLVERGLLQRLAGNLEAARADFQQVTELEPEEGWSFYLLSTVHHMPGTTEAATSLLATAIRTDGTTPPAEDGGRKALNVAVYLLASGSVDEAKAQLRRVLADSPSERAVLEAIDDFEEIELDDTQLRDVAVECVKMLADHGTARGFR